MKTTLGIIDDHQLFPDAFEYILEKSDVQVVMNASNGQDLRYRLEDGKGSLPEIMMVDTDMPLMNGIETTVWLQKHHPSVKLVAMALDEKDKAIIPMLKAGCCGFLYKTLEPGTYLKAFKKIISKGYYNAEANDLMFLWEKFPGIDTAKLPLKPDKQRFLELACSDLRYEEILQEMKLTQRQANRYIDALFRKFHVNGRNGLAFEALRKGFITLPFSG